MKLDFAYLVIVIDDWRISYFKSKWLKTRTLYYLTYHAGVQGLEVGQLGGLVLGPMVRLQ